MRFEKGSEMSERKRRFSFNTAITGVDETTGKFDEDAHRKQVLPLRGRIMQLDGMTGCYIARYGLEVEFLDTVTEEATVEAHVLEAVRWAAGQDGFFLLRGDKTPAATMDRPEPREPQHRGWLYINFGTNVVDYPVSDKAEGWDAETFRASVQELAKKMTGFDGAVNYQLRLRTASITFDTQVTNREAVEAHLRQVFTDAAAGGEFFPFVGQGGLNVTFQYSEE